MTAVLIPATTTLGRDVVIAVAGLFLVQLLCAFAVANYGWKRGYSFNALAICGIFLPWPLVLLAVTIGAGPRAQQHPAPVQRTDFAAIEYSPARRGGF